MRNKAAKKFHSSRAVLFSLSSSVHSRYTASGFCLYLEWRENYRFSASHHLDSRTCLDSWKNEINFPWENFVSPELKSRKTSRWCRKIEFLYQRPVINGVRCELGYIKKSSRSLVPCASINLSLGSTRLGFSQQSFIIIDASRYLARFTANVKRVKNCDYLKFIRQTRASLVIVIISQSRTGSQLPIVMDKNLWIFLRRENEKPF